MKSVGREFKPEGFPAEFFSLTGNNGTQIRATVSSFGPILLGKVLDLTDTQQSVLAMVFKYCDDRQMPLLDFPDLRDVLNYLGDEGKAELKNYGGMSAATVGVLIRKMVELEQQGAGRVLRRTGARHQRSAAGRSERKRRRQHLSASPTCRTNRGSTRRF